MMNNVVEQSNSDIQDKLSKHTITVKERNFIEITGVKNVLSLDDTEALFDTEFGFMTIRGNGLLLQECIITKGIVTIKGTINDFVYLDNIKEEKQKFLKNPFK